MAWPLWVAYIILAVAMVAMSPKPQNTKPPALSDLKAPTADDGREIPVLFGTRVLSAPNVVWYGHMKTKAVKASGGKK
jgi:hypothetical protein